MLVLVIVALFVVAGLAVEVVAGRVGSGVSLGGPTQRAVCRPPKGLALSSFARSDRLSGPAVTSLSGGAARKAFSVDGRDLTVRPPVGRKPTVSRLSAECDALASFDATGFSFLDDAQGGGLAVGYGLVTVAPNVGPGSLGAGTSGNPKPPPLPRYHDRLAWLVVVSISKPNECPFSTPTRSAHRVHTFGYEVFLLDAVTGRDALAYEERLPNPCNQPGSIAPLAFVPVEQVSVPWTLVSRNPDGYSARVAAEIPPCDTYSYQNSVIAPRTGNQVQVIAYAIAGATCGRRPKRVVFRLTSVASDHLPAHWPTVRSAPISRLPSNEPAKQKRAVRMLTLLDAQPGCDPPAAAVGVSTARLVWQKVN